MEKVSYTLTTYNAKGEVFNLMVTGNQERGLAKIIAKIEDKENWESYNEIVKITVEKRVKPAGSMFYGNGEEVVIWEAPAVEEGESLEETLNHIKEQRIADLMEVVKDLREKHTNAELLGMVNMKKLDYELYMAAKWINSTETHIENLVTVQIQKLQMKIQNKLGNVFKAHLWINKKGGFDGIIEGEKATANIQTVLAGGFIQKAHYRTLFNIK